MFRPGTRPAPTQRGGGGYPLGPAGSMPASVPENRHTSRTVPDDTLRDLARRGPSPQLQPGPLRAERGDRDRGRSHWSKPRANGPPQMDSQITHESSRGRVHDAAMDVDDALLTRSSDPPTKQNPPRRPALQDEAPRYPRAMLNSDNDGAPRGILVLPYLSSLVTNILFMYKGVRDTRDGNDSRHRFAADDSSRFGSSRDRQGMERHFADQTIQASLCTAP